MNRLGFIHAAGLLSYHACDKVEDILPTLRRAVAAVSEEEQAGDIEIVEKL